MRMHDAPAARFAIMLELQGELDRELDVNFGKKMKVVAVGVYEQ
jgi:hypothetical protein